MITQDISCTPCPPTPEPELCFENFYEDGSNIGFETPFALVYCLNGLNQHEMLMQTCTRYWQLYSYFTTSIHCLNETVQSLKHARARIFELFEICETPSRGRALFKKFTQVTEEKNYLRDENQDL